jgi:hypothetical protein
MTKVLPLLLLLLLTGCASPLVDAPRFKQIAAKRDFENLYYCGTKNDVHHFTLKREKQFPYYFRLPASEYPLKKPFPKTTNRSTWAPLQVSLYDGTADFRGVEGARLPPPPHYQASPIHNTYWLNQTNWPSAMTNGNLTYQFDISIRESSTNSISSTSFAEARASGKRYSARYVLRPQHALPDAPNKFENWTQTSYGPSFEWFPDGRLRMKTYHHSNGLKEYHFLDTNGRPVWSSYHDYMSNTSISLRYDTSGEVAMRSVGPLRTDEPDHPFTGKKENYIGDRRVTDEEFIKAASQYRREDIVGNKKP